MDFFQTKVDAFVVAIHNIVFVDCRGGYYFFLQ